MLKHRIHMDSVCYSSKPTKDDMRAISKRITNSYEEMNIVELSQQITYPNGKTWIPAYLEGERKNENWKSQSIYALDFDSGIPFQSILDRLNEYDIRCAFAYQTFSYSPDFEKFRVIFQLDHVVSDRVQRDAIQSNLRILFPESDKSCIDEARVFYGGKLLIYSDYDSFLNFEYLHQAARCFGTKNSKQEHLNQTLKRLDRKTNFCVKNGKNYINTIETPKFNTKSSKKKILLNADWDELRTRVKILDDFMNGEWLYHPELFGLATNLVYLKGGEKLFKTYLESNQNYDSSKKHLTGIVKHYGYEPQRLENFSPYAEDHAYANLLHASKKRGVCRIASYPTIKLAEAEESFRKLIDEVFRIEDNNIHVIRAATALGKTKALENLQGVVIAFPNHDLKDEVVSRMRVPVKITPGLPKNLPEPLKDRIMYYYSINAFSEANQLISEEAATNKDLESYLDQTFSAYASKETVLTTHPKGVFIQFDNLSTLVFDEDPISTLLSISKITINDLINLANKVSDTDDKELLNSWIRLFSTGEKNKPLKVSRSSFRNFRAIENEVISNPRQYTSNVLGFFYSTIQLIDANSPSDIYFIHQQELPLDKKIVILSATADEWIYKQLYGDRVKFYDLSNVEMMGAIEQDSTYTFSQTSLQSEKAVAYAQKQVENLPALTYAAYKHLFPNAVEEMHFGKLSGFDQLKGQDIAIVGAFHRIPVVYLLVAAVLGIEFTLEDTRMQRQTIERHGIRFPFITYTHEGLRNIQLFFLESEQEQAIGRARPLRHPVSIKLLSSLPHPQACINEYEKQARKKLEAVRR